MNGFLFIDFHLYVNVTKRYKQTAFYRFYSYQETILMDEIGEVPILI